MLSILASAVVPVTHITVNPDMWAPAVSDFVIAKIMMLMTLSIVFSPTAIIIMLLFSFGLPYLLVRTVSNINKKVSVKTSDIFRKNKSTLIILFALALFGNISYNQKNIADSTNIELKPYTKMCTVIPQKMLDMNYSDEDIMDAMTKSGCNAASLPLTKLFWSMIPKKPKPLHYLHGQWGYREELDT